MKENTEVTKSNPWLAVGVIGLIIVMIAGIFIYKNVVATKPPLQAATQQTNSAEKLPKLVDLGAGTCIPCKQMAPVLADLKKEYEGKLDVEVVDVNEERSKAMEYNVKHALRVIPTQILFDKNDKEVWSHEGFISKEDLEKIFVDRVGVK